MWLFILLVLGATKYLKTTRTRYISRQLLYLLYILIRFLILSFVIEDFLRFYIFFEISLVPLLAVILGWGYQVERVRARFYLFLYTLVGSFPLIVSLLRVLFVRYDLLWFRFSIKILWSRSYFLLFIIVLALRSFFVKLPLYLVHLWLPKAHVEAPAVGAIVLAAILLKLRAYGAYRVIGLFSMWIIPCRRLLVILLVIGAFLAALICTIQRDVKALIAYSSVRHIGVIMAGLISSWRFLMRGVWLVLLRHGFCSSALFFLANFNYEQNFSRQLLLNRGQGNLFYIIRRFWVLFLMANFSVPPFLRLLGELPILLGLFRYNYFFFFFLGLVVLIVSYFSVYLFRVLIHGRTVFFFTLVGELDIYFLMIISHFFPLLFFSMKVSFLLFCLNSLIKIKNCGFLDNTHF